MNVVVISGAEKQSFCAFQSRNCPVKSYFRQITNIESVFSGRGYWWNIGSDEWPIESPRIKTDECNYSKVYMFSTRLIKKKDGLVFTEEISSKGFRKRDRFHLWWYTYMLPQMVVV